MLYNNRGLVYSLRRSAKLFRIALRIFIQLIPVHHVRKVLLSHNKFSWFMGALCCNYTFQMCTIKLSDNVVSMHLVINLIVLLQASHNILINIYNYYNDSKALNY